MKKYTKGEPIRETETVKIYNLYECIGVGENDSLSNDIVNESDVILILMIHVKYHISFNGYFLDLIAYLFDLDKILN